MTTRTIALADCTFEILADGDGFRGLGEIRIGGTVVRSGRLPLRPFTQTFLSGQELSGLTLKRVDERDGEARLVLGARFRALPVKPMRDHSFDPIHELGDWDRAAEIEGGELDLVLRPARDAFGGVDFAGFSYHWEWRGTGTKLFWILDQASWELDGDIVGATAYNQSSCSAPVATFAPDTAWSTEAFLFWADAASMANRCMTHNLPRWASHQCFDFQRKGDRVLLGVFERLELIRTVIARDAGRGELKHFDKHIFDEAESYATSPKRILLRAGVASDVEAQNVWTWVFDECHRRARAEAGLRHEDPIPTMGHHHWNNYTIDTYYKDIVPACAAVGIKRIFAENFKRNDSSEPNRLINGNMCGSHEFIVSERHGGTAKLKEYVERCKASGIANLMWTCNYQSFQSPVNLEHRIEKASSWWIAMEDTRSKYNGAYMSVGSALNFKNDEMRAWWVAAHRKIIEDTGLDGFFVDSYYNLMWMPVNFSGGRPTTQWREALSAQKELQDVGCRWQIESFGPFGQPMHGHPGSYGPACAFVCYEVGYGNGYTTIPVAGAETVGQVDHSPAFIFHALAHKVPISVPLFIDGRRIDEVYGDEHRRILATYHRLLPRMRRRFLQEDGLAVLWHDDAGREATVWNLVDRAVALPGEVRDLETGEVLPPAPAYALRARRCYSVAGAAALPTIVATAAHAARR